MEDYILKNLVREGVVTNVDEDNLRVRVVYSHLDNMLSGWLQVLQHTEADVYVEPNGDHTHSISDSYSGGGSASTAGLHNHCAHVTTWMPKVNQRVLVLYYPMANGDGFVLGRIC